MRSFIQMKEVFENGNFEYYKELYYHTLEESANAYVPPRKVSAKQLTDPKEIKALMMKAKGKKANG